MIGMVLSNNFKLKSNDIRHVIENEMYSMGMCRSRNEFEERFIEKYGNLSELVLGSVMYGSGNLRLEYLVLMMPSFRGGKLDYNLELDLIAYDVKQIESYRDYSGFYLKQDEFEINDSVCDEIGSVIMNKNKNELPLIV